MFSPVNAGRMRLLQYHDPVNVSSESNTWGTTNRSRSFSCKSGFLTWSEDGLQRQQKPSVAQHSILFTNIDGDFLTAQSASTVGPDIRRMKVVVSVTARILGRQRSGSRKAPSLIVVVGSDLERRT